MNIKKIERIQNKSNRVFWFFEKMIARLQKYNEKINVMLIKYNTNIEEKRNELVELENKLAEFSNHAESTINNHNKQIETLKKFMVE